MGAVGAVVEPALLVAIGGVLVPALAALAIGLAVLWLSVYVPKVVTAYDALSKLADAHPPA